VDRKAINIKFFFFTFTKMNLLTLIANKFKHLISHFFNVMHGSIARECNFVLREQKMLRM
jgi:hypothetical protein